MVDILFYHYLPYFLEQGFSLNLKLTRFWRGQSGDFPVSAPHSSWYQMCTLCIQAFRNGIFSSSWLPWVCQLVTFSFPPPVSSSPLPSFPLSILPLQRWKSGPLACQLSTPSKYIPQLWPFNSERQEITGSGNLTGSSSVQTCLMSPRSDGWSANECKRI